MMTYQYITTEREERLFILTINRPEVMNAISPAASHEMAAALDEFEADNELWVAIITGAAHGTDSHGRVHRCPPYAG